MLPLWLVMRLVKNTTGTLAARGHDAFLTVTPTWPPARSSYRIRRASALGAGATAATLLVVLGMVLLYTVSAVGVAASVPPRVRVLVLAAQSVAAVALLA